MNVPRARASWWSGYNFTENDKGLILEVGYSYCTESMVGLDWYTEKNSKPASIAAVGYPGDYGGDSAAGVKEWASINGVSNVTVIPTGPNQVRGNQDAVVAAVKAANPSVVVLAVGPAENAEKVTARTAEVTPVATTVSVTSVVSTLAVFTTTGLTAAGSARFTEAASVSLSERRLRAANATVATTKLEKTMISMVSRFILAPPDGLIPAHHCVMLGKGSKCRAGMV